MFTKPSNPTSSLAFSQLPPSSPRTTASVIIPQPLIDAFFIMICFESDLWNSPLPPPPGHFITAVLGLMAPRLGEINQPQSTLQSDLRSVGADRCDVRARAGTSLSLKPLSGGPRLIPPVGSYDKKIILLLHHCSPILPSTSYSLPGCSPGLVSRIDFPGMAPHAAVSCCKGSNDQAVDH